MAEGRDRPALTDAEASARRNGEGEARGEPERKPVMAEDGIHTIREILMPFERHDRPSATERPSIGDSGPDSARRHDEPTAITDDSAERTQAKSPDAAVASDEPKESPSATGDGRGGVASREAPENQRVQIPDGPTESDEGVSTGMRHDDTASSGDAAQAGRVDPPGAAKPDAERPPLPEKVQRQLDMAMALLERAGVDPREIWGDRDIYDLDRQRVHQALNTGYPREVEIQMVRVARQFALDEGARGNPRHFAALYEYVATGFKDLRNALNRQGVQGPKRAAAAQLADDIQWLHEQLDRDRDRVQQIRPSDAAIPGATSVDDLPEAVRSCARAIRFESLDAAAYHARKHQDNLPAALQSRTDPMGAYFSALEKALIEGRYFPPEPQYMGRTGTRIVVHAEFSVPGGRAKTLEAILYAEPSGEVVVATFGNPMAKVPGS